MLEVNIKTSFIESYSREDGLLRVGGRLTNSSLSYSQKHPPILPSKDVLTKLLLSSLHISFCHCGISLLLAHVGSVAHIIGVRRLARAVCRSCVTCRKATARKEEQQMGQLPSSRVIPSPAFSKTGIDYAGPFTLKKGYTRKPVLIKAYMCIFVCFCFKAVHLEVVSDLSTESFIAALKRFISRRGLPTELHSDNGSNFKGAANDMKNFYQFLANDSTQRAIYHHLLFSRINWIFSPERAPHFGGLWESAVKSAKFHLKRVIGQQKLTYEEFSTVLCQIESCLNSRPLVPISSHSDDGIEVLTPGHFLIGRPLNSLPEANVTDIPQPLKHWMLVQSISQHWWQRWSKEYLQQLQCLHKWKQSKRNINVGDIVLILEDSPFITRWPMARVTNTYPGQDGKVRVVQVRTATSSFKRTISKLALLLPPEH